MEISLAIVSRLKEFRNMLNLKQETIAEKLNISRPAYTRIETGITSLSINHIETLIKEYNLNAQWLLTGVGEPQQSESKHLLNLTSNHAKIEMKAGVKPIHLYDLNVFGSTNIDVYQDDQMFLEKNILYIPDIMNAEFAFRVKGDSMSPEIKNNDIVAVKSVLFENIIWGKLHVIITNSTRVVKFVHKSPQPETICLISINREYEPIYIALKDVLFFYEVVATIKTDFK